MKVFFDTNVVIAAFATRGLCADLFAHVLLEHDLVVGEVVLAEAQEAAYQAEAAQEDHRRDRSAAA